MTFNPGSQSSADSASLVETHSMELLARLFGCGGRLSTPSTPASSKCRC